MQRTRSWRPIEKKTNPLHRHPNITCKISFERRRIKRENRKQFIIKSFQSHMLLIAHSLQATGPHILYAIVVVVVVCFCVSRCRMQYAWCNHILWAFDANRKLKIGSSNKYLLDEKYEIHIRNTTQNIKCIQFA